MSSATATVPNNSEYADVEQYTNVAQAYVDKKYKLTCIWGSLISITIILLCTLLPLSFKYVEYNEMAFDRNKFGIVDTNNIVNQGCHFIPLNHELIKFPTTFQRIAFLKSDKTALSIFTQDGYQISIEIQFYYRLLDTNLKKIYDLYSMNYEIGIINLAKLIIRDLSGSATSGVYLPLQSYISNRTYIQSKYSTEINLRMKNDLSIDVPIEYFKIIELDIPLDMVERYQRTVIQLQDNEVRENTQQVTMIEAQTDKMVSVINAHTKYILESSLIESNYIKLIANTTSLNIVSNANLNGFDKLCKILNINNSTDIIKLSKILNLMENPATKLIYNLNSHIILN
jgi:hypothetical protein